MRAVTYIPSLSKSKRLEKKNLDVKLIDFGEECFGCAIHASQ